MLRGAPFAFALALLLVVAEGEVDASGSALPHLGRHPSAPPSSALSQSAAAAKVVTPGEGGLKIAQVQEKEEPATENATKEPPAEAPAAEQPAVGQPAAEEPVVTQPAAEEPVVTQPAAEEPVVTQPAFGEPPESTAVEDPAVQPVPADPAIVPAQPPAPVFPANTAPQEEQEAPHEGIGKWIRTQLLPQSKLTAMEMQAEVDRAAKAVVDCRSFHWNAEKEVEYREQNLEQDESNRFRCLSMEHHLHKAEKDTCGDLTNLAEVLTASQPKGIDSIKKNLTPENVEEVLRQNYAFVNDYYPKLVQKKSGCDEARDKAATQHGECVASEEDIEEFYCTMKAGRDKACADYTACYKEKVKRFNKIIKKVKVLEEHNKNQFKQMTCFHNSMKDEEAPEDCDQGLVDTTHLDVIYPPKPGQEQCVHLMKTRRDYSKIVCDGSKVSEDSPISAEQANMDASELEVVSHASSAKSEGKAQGHKGKAHGHKGKKSHGGAHKKA